MSNFDSRMKMFYAYLGVFTEKHFPLQQCDQLRTKNNSTKCNWFLACDLHPIPIFVIAFLLKRQAVVVFLSSPSEERGSLTLRRDTTTSALELSGIHLQVTFSLKLLPVEVVQPWYKRVVIADIGQLKDVRDHGEGTECSGLQQSHYGLHTCNGMNVAERRAHHIRSQQSSPRKNVRETKSIRERITGVKNEMKEHCR